MGGKKIARNFWLDAIEMISENLFWGIGYFFGFTLVTMLSFGMVFAEEYSTIVRGRKDRHRFWLFKRDGNFYMVAQLVSAVGWLFLASVIWLINFMS